MRTKQTNTLISCYKDRRNFNNNSISLAEVLHFSQRDPFRDRRKREEND